MNLRAEPGFLGTDASLAADITLVVYVLILLPLMLVGYRYARRRMFEPQHKTVMTSITALNWVLILLVMALSYGDFVAPSIPDRLGDTAVWLPTLHLITGGVAQIMATVLVARMWLEDYLPAPLVFKNIKTPMRITLSLWIITVLLGFALYLTWYTGGDSSSAGDAPVPASTEEAATEDTTDAPEPASTEEAATEDTTGAPEPASTEDAATEDTTGAPEPASTEDAATEDTTDAPEPASTEDAQAP